MEFNKKIYHSQVFRDCIKFFNELKNHDLTIIEDLSFAEKFLSPIEYFIEKNKENLNSKEVVSNIKKSFDENVINFKSKIQHDINKKIMNYIKSDTYSKKPLEYYSWVLDTVINQINQSKAWDYIVDRDYTYYSDNQPINRNQVFLSYSSIDKALTYWLYRYFEEKHVFLYVDWMFGKYYDSGVDSKKHLDDELKKSNEFLYLRTLNSEISGGKYTRSWCGWEIGRSYQYHDGKQYHCDDFAVKSIISPSILDGFNEFYG